MGTSIEEFRKIMAGKPVDKAQVNNAFSQAIRSTADKAFLDQQQGYCKKEATLISVNPELRALDNKDSLHIVIRMMSSTSCGDQIHISEAALDELIKALVETRSELGALKKAYNEELAKLPAEEEKQD